MYHVLHTNNPGLALVFVVKRTVVYVSRFIVTIFLVLISLEDPPSNTPLPPPPHPDPTIPWGNEPLIGLSDASQQ
jgi:hypothetical protein